MEMKQYELETGTIGFIPISSTANRFKIFNDEKPYLSYFEGVETKRDYISDGNWQPLGLSTELKEEDLKEVMPKVMGQHYLRFPISNKSDRWCKTPLEAFKSLYQNLGLNPTQPHFVLFKKK